MKTQLQIFKGITLTCNECRKNITKEREKLCIIKTGKCIDCMKKLLSA